MTTPDDMPPRGKNPMLLAGALVLGAWVLLVIFYRYGADEGDAVPPPYSAIGRSLTSLRLDPLVGQGKVLTPAKLKGKVVLLNFWGPWCTYCRVEMPHLVEINQRFAKRDDFQFVSVSCSARLKTEDLDELRRESETYLNSKGYEFPVHCDSEGRTRRAVVEIAKLEDSGFIFPMTLILDQQGTVRAFFPGYVPGIETEISQVIEELLAHT